jgi:transcriptional regulator with XRE-family HTH domain
MSTDRAELKNMSALQTVSILDFARSVVQDALNMEPLYTEFGRILREARTEAKLTQVGLAERVGLSRTSITNIERGNQHVGLHLLYQLANALGVSPTDLLPKPEDVRSAGPELDDLLAPLRGTDRARVRKEIASLSSEDGQRLLQLLAREGVLHAGSEG